MKGEINSMNAKELERKLKAKITEAEPSLDLAGADKKVFDVALQDLHNYIKFLTKPTNAENPQYPPAIDELLPKDQKEIDAVISVWVGLWLKKWKQRFNLLINPKTNPFSAKAAERAEKMQELWLQFESRDELKEIVISELIRNAEICGTVLISESIIKTELTKQKSQDHNSKASSIALLTSTLHRARELSQKVGPLVSIKIDKDYYCQVNA